MTAFVATLIIGLALLLGGGFFLYLEMQSPPTHNAHVFTFAGIALLGALIIRPDPIFAVVKQVVVIVTPFIPVIGGRRAGDPPAKKDDGVL